MSAQLPVDQDIPLSQTAGVHVNEKDAVAHSKEAGGVKDSDFWLQLASSNYITAKSYQDTSLITQWERNADNFNNRHWRRSAYNSQLYRGRSRLFRPLTRGKERSSSAEFAGAMFSNIEVFTCAAENQNDQFQVAAARVMKSILAYRLDKFIPWYLTAMGAWQDTRVYGPCCTYTHWEFEEQEQMVKTPVKDGMGKEIPGKFTETKEMVTVIDEPAIDMIPPENLLLDPACDWRDPIKTSPYVVRLVPMYVVDIESKMKKIDTKTELPEWIPIGRDAILAASTDAYNTVRQAREGDNRPDKTDAQERPEFKVAWAHENFVRIDGDEWVYWTLGTNYLLSKPVLLRDAYLAGIRPFVYGFSVIEAHKFSPSSTSELISSIQAGINDIANLRIDNIRLALNKRYIIRRGAVVDLEALMRSVPGGGIMTDNIDTDIKVIETRDVTASSYKEQERLETEADGVAGSFGGSSVQNNRALSETVGGMEIASASGNAISEMDTMTFIETWYKPQLEMLMLFEQAYESDEVILNTAFEEALESFDFLNDLPENDEEQIANKKSIIADAKSRILNRVSKDKIYLKVNVGKGATSPQRLSESLGRALKSIVESPAGDAKLDWDEVIKEIWAINGFKDGGRFLLADNKDEEKLTEADLEAAREEGMQAAVDTVKMEQIASSERIAAQKLEQELVIADKRLAAEVQMHTDGLANKMQLDMMKDGTKRDETAVIQGNKANETAIKSETTTDNTGT